MNCLRTALLGALTIGWVVACGEPPPPKPPPTPPPADPAPAPEPPPPPKCEGINEGCEAKADTEARIPGTHYVFTPPKGWIYAQLEECTVAQVGEQGAVLMLTTHEKLGRLPAVKKRGELVASLSELVGITPRRRQPPLVRPNQTSEIAGLEMSLWERSGATRAGDVGALLILAAPLGDESLFGVGFAPKSDEEGTGLILKALQTLKEGDEKAPPPGGDEDDKK